MGEYVIAKYIRLSLDDNITDSLSIPNQHLLLDRHIEDMEVPNTTVIEFVDNGFSGTTVDRPAFQEMLELVACGRVNCIVTKDFSRFSRNAIESGYYIEQVFPLYRIRFIAVSDGYDSADYKNSTGGIEVAFKFLMHEHYSLDLSKKIKSAKRIKMRSGENIVAKAIYGYHKAETGKWEPEEPAAGIVRQIFKMALDGLPTVKIRDTLSASRQPTPKEYMDRKFSKKKIESEPKCVWTARMVLSILENEQYIGTYVSGKWEQKAVGGSQIHTDKDKWIIIPYSHTPIISKEDFTAVQEILSRFKGATTVKPLNNLLEDENRYKRSRMVSGEWIAGNALYGYTKTKTGKWVIDDTAAAVIREIYDMGLLGLSSGEISAKLSEKRYPIPSHYMKLAKDQNTISSCQWTKKSVRTILTNIQYTGAFVSGKQIKDYETGKSFRPSKNDWIIIPGKNPAIISKEIFDEVQAILFAKKYRRKDMRPREYLLRGNMVKCGCCGYAMMYDDSVKEVVFRCQHSFSTPDAECHKMKVSADELDEAVLTIIKKQAEVVLNTSDLSGFRKIDTNVRRIDECEKQLNHLVEQRQACYEKFIGQEISREEYQSIKSDCAAQIERLNNQLALLRQLERDKDAHKKAAGLAKVAFDETATPRDIVKALVDKIFVSPGNQIAIRWKFANFAMGS